jgi:DNA-directed RNA polymerase subunit RPC12/RpoP
MECEEGMAKTEFKKPKWNSGKITISCPKCGLDRGKEVCGIGTACPKCGFKPELERVNKK